MIHLDLLVIDALTIDKFATPTDSRLRIISIGREELEAPIFFTSGA